MKEVKDISVIGLGKLGLCMAACLADKNFNVIGVDVNQHKIDLIKKAKSPIQETGLEALLKKCRRTLGATIDFTEAIKSSQVSFVVVGTPSEPGGSFSNKYLKQALERIAEALKEKDAYHLVVITSTVMPGTTGNVAKPLLEGISGKKCGLDFGLAYNPEFIALGSVIHDFRNPDFILIGEINRKDGDALETIYKRVCEVKPRFARMNTLNAEIAKIALNCYVTTKITFANHLAEICEKAEGSDAYIITEALGLDSRIGSKYLKPGLGYGGPCFPRDNVAFSTFVQKLKLKGRLTEVVNEINCQQALRVVNRIKEILFELNKDKDSACIGLLGLAYKPNTAVIEQSQALEIAQLLVNEGYRLKVYDPQAQEEARSILGDRVRYARDKNDCLCGVDLGVITVPWGEFKKIDFAKLNKNIVLLDCWGLLASQRLNKTKIRFLGRV